MMIKNYLSKNAHYIRSEIKQCLLVSLIAFLPIPIYSLTVSQENELKQIFETAAVRTLEIGGYALYLVNNDAVLPNTGSEVETYYNWGLELNAKYENEVGHALFFDWLHYKNKQNNLTKLYDDLNNEGRAEAQYSYISKFDIMTLSVGQALYYSSKLAIYLYGGGAYVNFKAQSNFSFVTPLTQTTTIERQSSRYFGGGGLAGLDLHYYIRPGLKVYIEGEFMLVSRGGKFSSREQSTDNTGPVSVPSNERTESGFTGAMAGADIKVGASYHKKLEEGAINFHLGWLGIGFDEEGQLWSGAFFGAKWLGEI